MIYNMKKEKKKMASLTTAANMDMLGQSVRGNNDDILQ
jgi:hypothetical protein